MSSTALRKSARVALVGALLVAATISAAGGTAGATVPVDEVHYTFGGPTSVTLDWRGDAQDVQYGLTATYTSSATGAAPAWTPTSSADPFWQAQLTGLAAGTTYHYSIGGGPDFTFHTPPTGDFRFDAIGDIGDTSHFSHLGDTFSAIASDQPSFVLMIGDLTYANAANATQAVVDQHFNDVMAFSTSAAYMPAWGNHEWESASVDDLRNYKGRLLMPNAALSPGSPAISDGGNDWGWFDAGGVRFIAYPEPYTSAVWPDWQTHANALMTSAQNDASVKYIVTYGHRPAYSTGYHPGDATLAGILNGLGASYSKYVLNINGHSHDYERFQPIDGVTHITAGTPSSEETPWGSTDPNTAYRAFHLAHLRVDVDATGMLIQAVCDDAASHDDIVCAPGSVIDEYAIGTPPQSPPVTAFYVDKTNAACSDAGPGDVAAPYCTIGKGTSRLQPGQTLFIGNGTYAEQVTPPSGTAVAPVTVTALPGTSPVVTGTAALTHGVYLSGRSYVNISGLTVSGAVSDGVYVTNCANVTLTGLRVTLSGQPTATGFAKGMKIIGTTNSTVSGNTVDHNTDSGIYLAQGSTGDTVSGNATYANARVYTRAAAGIDLRSGGNTVRYNVTHDNEDSGIQLYTGSDGSLVVDNVSYRNGDHGIDDYQATNQRIIGNSVYRNTTAGINLEGGSTGGLVENNISVDNGLTSTRSVGDIRVDVSAQTGTVVNYNNLYLHASGAYYVWGTTNYASVAAFNMATGQEARGVQADPRWASPDTGSFVLTAGSPAIDSADSTASGELAVDIVGTPRYDDPNVVNGTNGYDDRGAYEAPAGTTDHSPNAVLTVSPGSGTVPFTVTANASASSDTDATGIATYAFDFGDGSASGPQAGATATHTYTVAGTYSLAVSVTDTAGLTTTAAAPVAVGTAGNLVTNSTFETDLTGWAPLAGCNLTRVAGGHNGGWAADLNNPLTSAQTCTLNDSPNWVAHAVSGTYTATVWLNTAVLGGSIKLRIREYNGATLLGTGTTTVNPTGDWQQVTLTYTVSSPGSTLDLNVYETSQPAGSDLLIDDVTLRSN
jgi:parallel beta-helix repeat protein